MTEIRATCSPVLGQGMAYEGGAGNRKAFMENVYDVAAPAETMIMYHHEMAYNAFSPTHIAFGCLANSDVSTGFSTDFQHSVGRSARVESLQYKMTYCAINDPYNNNIV